jgi:GNAT superfamily N-acetyltransferase
MTDMLARLYDLPEVGPERNRLAGEGIVCRRAESYERTAVLEFVREHWPGWVDECEAAFARVPATMFIALEGTEAVGFACYHAARPNFFGPTAVLESHRKRGIGRVLLLQCLNAMAAEGYAYAIIAGVGPEAFYERSVGAFVIPESETGIYTERVGGWGGQMDSPKEPS